MVSGVPDAYNFKASIFQNARSYRSTLSLSARDLETNTLKKLEVHSFLISVGKYMDILNNRQKETRF